MNKKDIYKLDADGYPYGYIELYHRDKTTKTTRLAVRGRKLHRSEIGYYEVHFDHQYENQFGKVCYNIT
jgi:hypothetical protein